MREVSERINSIREEMINTIPEIFSDRAVLITESYEKTLGQPYIIRRARALEHILLNMKICIQNKQLIAGSFAGKTRGSQVFPEYDMEFIIKELDDFANRTADHFYISQENKEILKKIFPKWQGNTVADVALDIFPEIAREGARDYIYLLTALRSGIGHIIIDYQSAISLGITGVLEKIEKLQNKLSFNEPDFQKKSCYYQALKIVCQAVIAFADRFAALA